MSEELIKVTGLQEMIKKLETLPDKILKKILKAEMKKLAQEATDKLRQVTPRSSRTRIMAYHHRKKGERTGKVSYYGLNHLVDSYKASAATSKKKGTVGANVKGEHYAKYPEFGTKFQKEQEFIRRAFGEIESTRLTKVIDSITDKINDL